MSATTSTNIVLGIVFYCYLALLMQIRAVLAICFDLKGRQPFKINFYYVLPMLLLLLLNTTKHEERNSCIIRKLVAPQRVGEKPKKHRSVRSSK